MAILECHPIGLIPGISSRHLTRFKPETKLKSYYYYDNSAGMNLSREEMDKAIERLVLTSDINPKSILTPEQMREKIDLSAEEYRYVFLIERENGQKAFLRMFDDQGKYPSEAEISAVLKTMVSESPRIAFLNGHGERNIYDGSGVNYTSFTTVLDSRGALVNQGLHALYANADGRGRYSIGCGCTRYR